MPTKDQTRANRANARHSTGPRTAAGKAKSSQNALKHGLRAQATVLPDENADDFYLLVDALEDQFHPQTAIEWTLLRQLADAEWRMRRVPCLEAGLIAKKLDESLRYYDHFPERLPDDAAQADLVVIGTAAASDATDGDALSKLSRYEARLSHRYFKALEHLQRIQCARNQKPETGDREPKPENRPPAPTAEMRQPKHPPHDARRLQQPPPTHGTPSQPTPAALQLAANQQHRTIPRTKPSNPGPGRQTNPITSKSTHPSLPQPKPEQPPVA